MGHGKDRDKAVPAFGLSPALPYFRRRLAAFATFFSGDPPEDFLPFLPPVEPLPPTAFFISFSIPAIRAATPLFLEPLLLWFLPRESAAQTGDQLVAGNSRRIPG
jgi:hypothetical protein